MYIDLNLQLRNMQIMQKYREKSCKMQGENDIFAEKVGRKHYEQTRRSRKKIPELGYQSADRL